MAEPIATGDAGADGLVRRLFTAHPESVGESYREHMRVSASFGGAMLLAGAGCLVHALIPALCKRTGSSAIKRLYARLHKDPSRDGRRPDYEI